MDWLAGGLELSGLWLVGNKRWVGFIFNITAGLCWIYVAVVTGVYGLLLVVIPALFVNTRNTRRWIREGKGSSSIMKGSGK